jgi:PAS domain S-box-containing protein
MTKPAARQIVSAPIDGTMVLDDMTSAVCVTDSALRVLYLNRAARQTLGLAEHAGDGEFLPGLFPVDTRARLNAALERAVRGVRTDRLELQFPGTLMEAEASPCIYGALLSFRAENADSADRSATEAALRETSERFRRVFDQSPLGKATAGRDFRFLEANPALCRMLGYAAEELVGRNFTEFVHPDDVSACIERGQQLVAGTIPQLQLEERFIHKSGKAFWVRINVGPIRDPEGRFLYSLGVIEDIDEHRRMVEALEASEQQLRELTRHLEELAGQRTRQLESSRAQLQAFFETSPDWLTFIRARRDGQFTYADINAACEQAYGLPRAEVIGRTPESVLGDEAAREPMQRLRACIRTGLPQHYVASRTIANRTRTIDVMFALVPGETDTGDRFIITAARDVTEREELEAQLHQAQKLEAVGKLTGGVAHDFNNLLAVIMGNAELAKRRVSGRAASLMDNILRAGDRGVTLTRQLLSFSRHEAGSRELLDLSAEMPRIADMLRASLRGDIELRVTMDESVWPIEADPSELEIALLNLAVNGRDAMPSGGLFEITVTNDPLGAPAQGLPGPCVSIACRDTGTGIPPEVIDRVVDPFFTTKEQGSGTGLGLSQVYGFARQSGGGVTISSSPGQGTTVSICLPRSTQQAGVDRQNAPADTRLQGRALLVEDNVEVANVVASMLETMGFTVETIDRAAVALTRLEESGAEFRILLSDVVMPGGMTGLDLARVVRERFPALPLVLMSGYNDALAGEMAGFRMLRKPVPYARLHDTILESLRTQS